MAQWNGPNYINTTSDQTMVSNARTTRYGALNTLPHYPLHKKLIYSWCVSSPKTVRNQCRDATGMLWHT